MRGYCIAVFTMVCLCACRESQYAGYIQTLDSLKTEVKNVQADFARLDSVRMAQISSEVHAGLKNLQQVYQPDSIDMDDALLINAYKDFRKTGPQFAMQRTRLHAEIPYTLRQLESLLTDLRNGSLKPDDARKYVETEKNAATGLITLYSDYKEQTGFAAQQYDSVNVIMTRFIDSLRSDSLNIQVIRLKNLKAKTKKRK